MTRFDRLTLLKTFIRTAERGSLTAAARDLGVSQPTVTRQLNELESLMGGDLMHRTTHGLALTEAGRALMGDARDLLASWDGIAERLGSTDEMIGSVRVVAPVALGQRHLIDAAIAFQREHPAVSVVWQLTDAPIRFDEEGCDCWFRVGPVPDERLVVRRLAHVERLVVGAPDYADRAGQNVANLPWVTLSPYEGERVRLWDEKGKQRVIDVVSRTATNNIFAQTQTIVAGLGVGILPRWFVREELRDGRLVDVAPGLRAESLPINLAFAPSRKRPRRLDVFMDRLTEAVRTDVAAVDA